MKDEFRKIMASEGFLANDEQLAVIDTSLNSVVSAGAGAGKTAVLSWRFLRLVLEENVKPEEILTLTFTKKAAAEMRERIYKRLIKASESVDMDSFSRATISTLDSFCAQIARSDALSYGFSRDIGNLDDGKAKEIAERLAYDFLQNKDNEEEVKLISSLFMPNEVMDKFFLKIASKVTITGDYTASKISKRFYDVVVATYKKQREILSSAFSSLSELHLTKSLSDQLALLDDCLQNESFQEKDYFRMRGKTDEDIKAIIKEIINPILKDNGHFRLQDYVKKNDRSPGLLQIAVEKYAKMINEEKRILGLLSFSDVSALAVAILRDNLEMRRIFRRRYRFIMIDEFQDNNSLQRDLLFLLSEREGVKSESGRVPTVEELDEKKLFFVGDEKQSIYRFRGADVSVFRALQTDIAKNGRKLSLSVNYRSQSPLIDHFNQVFEKVLENGGESFAAQFESIKAGKKSDGTKSKIIFASYNKDEIEKDDEDLYDGDMLEAEAIGNYCQRILETEEFLVEGRRPLPHEVAILFRSASNQMNIEKALRKRNIPYQLTETRSLMLDAVAGDFYSFLQSLIYPDDRRSYVALLKSPFCGLCDESIFNLILDGKSVLDVDRERYEAFSLFYENVKEEAFRLTLPSLLEKLYIEGGYYGYLSSLKDRSTFIEHYDYLFSYALSYEEEGRGLTDFVAFLRDELGDSRKLSDASVLKREVSGVQIMTVHKSKGLEFPIVIFAGLGKRGHNSENEYVFNYDDMLVATEDKQLLKILNEDEKQREEAEAKRVMYVAFTRAEEHLISIGGYKINKDGEVKSEELFEWYAAALGANLDNMSTLMEGVILEDVTSTPFLKPKWSDRKYLEYDFSNQGGFINEKRRISVSDIKRSEEKELDKKALGSFDADEIVRREHIEAEFGTLCHLCLEKLIGKGSYDDVECTILPDEKDNAILLSRAKAFADSFKKSELYRKYVEGKETLEELRFYTNLDIAPGMAVEGVIDLVVLGKDFNLVVDYKSDSFKDPEEHKIQILSYIKVVKDLYPDKECYGTLYYLREGKTESFWNLDGEEVEL